MKVTCPGMPPRVSSASQVKGREAIHWNMAVNMSALMEGETNHS